MKRVINKLWLGISVGCVGFVMMLFISAVIAGSPDTFLSLNTGRGYLTLAVCFIAIAVGFSLPSLVYDSEKLATGLKILIHMTIGTVIYLITAFSAGWVESSVGAAAVYVLIAIGTAAFFWVVYMICFRLEARRINARIREKNQN